MSTGTTSIPLSSNRWETTDPMNPAQPVTSTFTRNDPLVDSINNLMASFHPITLPHNPNLVADAFYFEDLGAADSCYYRLRLRFSAEKDPDPWEEDRMYDFNIMRMDSVSAKDHCWLYFTAINSAKGEATITFEKRGVLNKERDLFYTKENGYYMIIYSNTPEDAKKMASFFEDLKASCRL